MNTLSIHRLLTKKPWSQASHWMAPLLLAAWVASSHAAGPASDKTEVVRAQVVRVDAQRGDIILRHEAINSIAMGAMTMPFKARDRAMLAPLKAGDRVTFSVVLVDDEPVVTDIRRVRGGP
ncbi:MAG: transporter [Polaromonas sp.]|jgi:Cu(I)/Ag(I) efflux system protein CusF|nr:transporter [Polaromonas sp.]